jgi:phage terminase small subunit
MAGRKRKPTALHVIEGTLRAGRTNQREPKPELAMPEPPAFLDEHAKAEWFRLVPYLYQCQIMTDGETRRKSLRSSSRLIRAFAGC